MHMLHMHISMDIIITALSFFITDFLLSSVFVGVPALIGWHGNAFASICQPPFLHSGYLPKKKRLFPTILVQFRHKIRPCRICQLKQGGVGKIAQRHAFTRTEYLRINLSKTVSRTTPPSRRTLPLIPPARTRWHCRRWQKPAPAGRRPEIPIRVPQRCRWLR